MAQAQAEPKLKRAAIGGFITFAVIEVAFLFMELPAALNGYNHAAALLFGLAVFIGVLVG